MIAFIHAANFANRFIGYVVYSEMKKKNTPLPSDDKLSASIIQDAPEEILQIEPAAPIEPVIESKAKESDPPKGIFGKFKRDAEEILAATYYPHDYSEMTWLSKGLFYAAGGHFELLLRLSIPPYDKNKWDRRLAVLFPIFGGLLKFIVMPDKLVFCF